MIDLIELSRNTTIECSLSDLYSALETELRLHLYDDETPNLCMITKKKDKALEELQGDLSVQLVTPYRIVRAVAYVDEKKREIYISKSQPIRSSMLNDYVGLRHWESPPLYYLKILTRSDHDFSLVFASSESRRVFTKSMMDSFRAVQR